MDAEVVIVGAGSAGLQAARNLIEKAGITPLIVEEHKKVGFPEHCTGLVSLNGIREALRLRPEAVSVNYLRGAHIVSPSGYRVTVKRSSPVAAVLDRPLYEQTLLELVSSQARVLLGVRATVKGGALEVNGALLRPRLVVDASGLRSLRARHPELSNRILPALQYDVRVRETGSEHAYIFLGSEFSEGLFAWAVPLSGDVYRVGLASMGNVLERLEHLLKRIPELSKGEVVPLSRLKVLGGAVYTGGLVEQQAGNVVFVGDSAGQTKPTTGGGLVYHSLASAFLAEAVKLSRVELYEKRVMGSIGREIRAQKILRDVLNALGDRGLDRLILAVRESGGEELISRYGDMDLQSPLIPRLGLKMLAKNPSIFLDLLRAILHFLIA